MKIPACCVLLALAFAPPVVAAGTAAPDAAVPSPAEADRAALAALADLRRQGDEAAQSGRSPGIEPWREYLARIETVGAKYPDADLLSHAVGYLNRVRAHAPDQEQAVLRRFAQSPNRSVREMAAGWLRLLAQPLDLSFTAIDGRAVDVKGLRGKIVLVDFWATWCGPCRAEIPNVVAAYRKYHDRGFEVVGISLDRADAKQQVLDFTRAHDMPWPQHYDGKWWRNEIAVRYAIQLIPAMFLLDRDGMIVSTDARGPKLEREIERLLRR